MTFMARISQDHLGSSDKVYGIGVEEKVAVAVESNGRAYVYGQTNNYAHFMQQTNALDGPEECVPGKPLDWFRSRKAVNVYRVMSNKNGDRYFDLNSWNTGTGGTWMYYYVDRGFFSTA